MNINKESKEFASLIFLLLGVLFGVLVMVFIFANIGDSLDPTFTDSSEAINSESGFINQTGYTLVGASSPGFDLTTIIAVNTTSGAVIASGNFTVSASGVVTNATATVWPTVTFNYTFTATSDQEIVAQNVVNNTLNAAEGYSEQSDTQFTTLAVAITLLVLLALFGLFWKFFMGKDKTRKRSSSGYGGGYEELI